jgi:hypothetical protein
VLTTKALLSPHSARSWLGVASCVCLELDYRRTITLTHGAEHKNYKSPDLDTHRSNEARANKYIVCQHR